MRVRTLRSRHYRANAVYGARSSGVVKRLEKTYDHLGRFGYLMLLGIRWTDRPEVRGDSCGSLVTEKPPRVEQLSADRIKWSRDDT